MRRPAVPAPLLVITSIAAVQCGSGIARTLFDDLGVAGVTLLRLTIAAVIITVVTQPSPRRWSGAGWRVAVVLGVVMAGMNLAFYLSAPIGGLLLAFAAGLCWAGYIVCGAKLGGLVPGAGGLAVSLAVAALIVVPFGAGGASAVRHEPSLLIGATAVALLSSVLSYGLEINALRRIPTRVFGILMSLEPAGAAVAGLLILHQHPGGLEIVALVLVTAASAGATLVRRDRAPEPVPAP